MKAIWNMLVAIDAFIVKKVFPAVGCATAIAFIIYVILFCLSRNDWFHRIFF